jgi:DNA invertase Pin-like site-specific DNA recombinase
MTTAQSPTGARAAQYVRMSTEHQNYSLEAQRRVIAAYAQARGYEIVQTYTDAGVSGLRLEGRNGLKQLLADVLAGHAGYSVILVYDVSRWGRFQDPDQSAHYEFICREAGVRIEYCAEPFVNDGALVSGIVKHLKRAMAAEYSRELSAKVAQAQRGLAEKGYWRGGTCGYGFRRCAVAPDGTAAQVMEPGEYKGLQGYRTILVPGPDCEIQTVRRIFRLFAIAGLGVRGISAQLNAELVASGQDRAWSPFRVKRLLSDEKYVGAFVLGRRTSRLKRVELQPRSRWVRVPDACPRLVEACLFKLAQSNMRHRRESASDESLIAELRLVLATYGRLSNTLIQADERAHCPAVYIKRFGGLTAAYALAGYEPSAQQRQAAARIPQHRPYLARGRVPRRTDEVMLRDLREVLRLNGRLTSEIIEGSPGVASSSEYRRRFGHLGELYALMGFTPSTRQRRVLAACATRRETSGHLRTPPPIDPP